MRTNIVQLDRPRAYDGPVVVIDVFRAFTTAAFALCAGIHSVECVESVQAALDLKRGSPGALLFGEEHGMAPTGFDLGNSPLPFLDPMTEMAGRQAIQRTSNGTRGLAWCETEHLYAAAAVIASATVGHLRSAHPGQTVHLVCTEPEPGEDLACARFLARELAGDAPSAEALAQELQQIAAAEVGRIRERHGEERAAAFEADYVSCSEVDCVDVVMQVNQTEPGRLVLQAVS